MFLVKCGKIGITKGADNTEKKKTGVIVSFIKQKISTMERWKRKWFSGRIMR